MQYQQGMAPESPDRFLKVTALVVGVLALLGLVALMWASGATVTSCDGGRSVTDAHAAAIERTVVYGCIAAALGMAGILLALSARRRQLGGRTGRRFGWVSLLLVGLTIWCAIVFALPEGAVPERPDNSAPALLLAGVPVALLVSVGMVTFVVKYVLLIPGVILLVVALTRSSRTAAYRWMQAAVVYAQLGCMAVATGAGLYLFLICLGD